MIKSDSPITAFLIHGLSDSRKVWSRQVDGLSPLISAITYDVRGFGESPVGRGDGTVDQMADDLAQIMSALNIGPAWLIGFSMGGVIAQRFAIDFPSLTKGLILIASSCIVGKAGLEFFDQRISDVSLGGFDAFAKLSATDARGCFTSGRADLVSEYQQIRSNSVNDLNGYLNACYAMRALADGSLKSSLEKISCPTLVIASELDPYCPPRASEMIVDAIPGAKMELVEGVGHCVHMEAAHIVNQLVQHFIKEHN